MQDLEEKKYWIWLSLIKGLGAKRKMQLLDLYNSPEKIYNLTKEKLIKIDGIGENIADGIIKSKNKELLNYHLKYMEQNSIDIINIFDKSYPQNLKQIYDPPVSLFIKGNKEILNGNNIGIVGCRECTDYGKNAAKYFSYNLAKENFNIVSGLAKGVDSFSHLGSLSTYYEQLNKNDIQNNNKECGKTIAVIGNGLNTIYPRENKEIAKQIIQSGGAIISEYPCRNKAR